MAVRVSARTSLAARIIARGHRAGLADEAIDRALVSIVDGITTDEVERAHQLAEKGTRERAMTPAS